MASPDASLAANVRAAVEDEIERLRDAALQQDGGCTVMKCVQLCALHALMMPPWLRERFVQMYAQVNDAHVRTWDEAIGPRWPSGMRMDTIRRTKHMPHRAYMAVRAELEADPSQAIDTELFGAAGVRINLSGGQTRLYYYRALGEGYINLAHWKCDELARRRSLPVDGRRDRKDFQAANS